MSKYSQEDLRRAQAILFVKRQDLVDRALQLIASVRADERRALAGRLRAIEDPTINPTQCGDQLIALVRELES